MSVEWCLLCSTRHESGQVECPGELRPTGPERHGWRVNVQTPHGIEAYGVLVAECDYGWWRARILTYPKILWSVPGGKTTMKFAGKTAAEAERQAVEFIRAHCAARGFALRDEPAVVEPQALPREGAVTDVVAGTMPAARKIRFIPVRYGLDHPTEQAGTGNLSESGLFILTESPLDRGHRLHLSMNVPVRSVALRGEVMWSRKEHHVGRSPGMGVRLHDPPPDYVEYVRSLP